MRGEGRGGNSVYVGFADRETTDCLVQVGKDELRTHLPVSCRVYQQQPSIPDGSA